MPAKNGRYILLSFIIVPTKHSNSIKLITTLRTFKDI